MVIAQSKRYLMHPDNNPFNILKALEWLFTKFVDSLNDFEVTCEDFFENNICIIFSWSEYRTIMLTDICFIYLIMRLHQYSYIYI